MSTRRIIQAMAQTRELRCVSDGSKVILCAAASDSADATAKLTITAYTGASMRFWWSSTPIVVDLATLVMKESTPLRFMHSAMEIIGHVTKWTKSDSALVAEALLSGANDRTREVEASLRKGLPWQASIGVSAEDSGIEFIPEGRTVKVNGRDFSGPVRVARGAELFELSVVDIGADSSTQTRLAAMQGDINMTFEQWCGSRGINIQALNQEQLAQLRADFDRVIKASGNPAKPKGDGPDQPPTPEDPDGDGGSGEAPTPKGAIQAMRAAAAEETRRINAVRTAAEGHPEIQAKAIAEGWTEDKTRLEVMLAGRQAPTAMLPSNQVADGDRAGVIEAGLLLASGMDGQQMVTRNFFPARVVELAAKHGPRSVSQLCHTICALAGTTCPSGSMSDATIRAGFEASRRITQSRELAAAYSTISLPAALANVLTKQALASWLAVNDVAARVTRKGSNPDFKKAKRFRLTANGELKEVPATGEIPLVGIQDAGFDAGVKTRGAALTIGREMLINDDVGAIAQVGAHLGRMAMLSKQKVLFKLWLANANNFFGTANKNYQSGAGTVLGIKSLSAARTLFEKQTDDNKEPIVYSPAILLVTPSLRDEADILVRDRSINETTAAGDPRVNANPHAGKFRVESSPWLSHAPYGGTDVNWWLLADPAEVACYEITYLGGRDTPIIEQGDLDFTNLGIGMRAVFDFDVNVQDHRGGVMSKGSA